MARRGLVVEQRLDMIGRDQSQRFFNPPCCADEPTCPPWTITVDQLAGADNGGSYGLDDAATVTALHFESPGGGSLYGEAIAMTVRFQIFDPAESVVWWESAFSFDASELAIGWTIDETPDVAFGPASMLYISCGMTIEPEEGFGGSEARIFAVVTIDGSCHDDASVFLGSG